MEVYKSKRNIKAFDGEKYSVWKFRIRALLTELNVIKVIDNEPREQNRKWIKAERIAKSIIVEYLSDGFLDFADSASTSREIFQKLDSIYERKSLATQLALRKRLLELKLQGDIALMEHFRFFDDLVTNLLVAGGKLDEADKVSHLLLTLPSSYNGVITAIETLSEDNLTLAFVKTRLLDHETKMKTENNETSVKVLSAENQNIQVRKNYFNSRKHFKINRKNQNKNKSLESYKIISSKIKCFHCGRKGHMKNNCYYYKKSNQYQKVDNNKYPQSVQIAQSSTENISSFAFMVGGYQLYNQDICENDKVQFILDSGASDHIINRIDLCEDFVELETPIKVLIAKKDEYIKITKKGQLNLTSNLGVRGKLENVLYCPDIPYNLLSVKRMQEAGMVIIFNQNGVEISKDNKIIMTGKSLNNLIGVTFMVNKRANVNIAKYESYELWHQRLGHIGKSKFLELKNKNMVEDIEQIENILPDVNICEPCINGKLARLPYNKIKNKGHVKRPLFIIHSDVCGPITPSTVNNKNYFVLFVDQYTHYCVTYLIAYKSEVFTVFKDFVNKSEAHFNLKIVTLYCDNGREYLSNEMKDYCSKKGITYHFTVPHSPQLNGVSERMVRTITEKARAVIAGASLNKTFWGEAVLTSTYLINITPTTALKQSKTPYEMWHGKKPQLKYLRVFGSTIYVHNKTRKSKFDKKSLKGVLVGYESNGYKVWDVEREKFIVARDVVTDETSFLKTRPTATAEGVNFEYTQNKTDASDIKSKSVVKSCKSDNSKSDKYGSSTKNVKTNNESNKSVVETDMEIDSTSQNTENKDKYKENLSLEPRRSERIRDRPTISYNENDMLDDYLFSAQSLVCKIPTSFEEIKNRDDRDKWELAIADEINSLLINKTWSLVEKPLNKNIVDCKWVFTIKNDEFGNPLKYKARLVARGFTQEYLVDYCETFAPVARVSSFRIIIAFANQFSLLVHHMDVNTAFLNGILREEIYMRVPDGVRSSENQVCKLHKAIYGLKQAARCWFELFEQSLIEEGFKNSAVDRCIYILDKGDVMKNIYLVLYVDDLVIATENLETMNNFKNYLSKKFSMTDLKDIKLFLGIRVQRFENKITLDQSQYIKTILNTFNMSDCKSVSTPLETKLDFKALNSDEKFEAPCRNVVGCLMYVMLCTRPDLSSAVNILSRYLNKNNKELWKNLKRVLRYLKGSTELKLTYVRGDFNNLLVGFVDSDWGGSDTNDRKSTTGYLFKLFEHSTISWNTKRQTSVAASSTEAEYMALFEAVREAMWLRSLVASINIKLLVPIIIYEDNTGCISIANNPTGHKRSKHIDIKYHFSREQIENKLIKLKYISTANQIADMLTKPLSAVKFLQLREGLGLK